MTLQKMLGLARPAALECLTEHGYETYDDGWRRLRRMVQKTLAAARRSTSFLEGHLAAKG